MSNEYDINIVQGSSFSFYLNASDVNGNPINISGLNVTGGIKYSFGCTGYLAGLNAMISGDGTSGIVGVSLSPAVTMSLPVTTAVYDVFIYDTGEYAIKPIRGYAYIHPSVSF